MRRVGACPRLIGEAFAVGDEAFQKKCVDKMNQFKAEGKTIVFVSHALDTIKDICQRPILLSKGRVATIGNIEKVMNDYLAMLQRGTAR